MNRFLLDTNVVIWLSEGKQRVNQIKSILFSDKTQIFISTVSWWEIAIKIRQKKYKPVLNELRFFAEKYNFQELPVTNAYIDTYLNLPYFHKDPFDHMLLAQAITSPMRLITGDAILAEYSSLVMVI
jgi:PIN domain nuclease of toxin-antitoxin system